MLGLFKSANTHGRTPWVGLYFSLNSLFECQSADSEQVLIAKDLDDRRIGESMNQT